MKKVWLKKASKAYVTGKEVFNGNLDNSKQEIINYLNRTGVSVEFKYRKVTFRSEKKTLPKSGDICEFEDYLGNKLKGTFDKLDTKTIPPNFISKEFLLVKNYCPCCAIKEPMIKIQSWDNLNKIVKVFDEKNKNRENT